MSFYEFVDPNDAGEIEKGMLDSLHRTLVSNDYVSFITMGVANSDATKKRMTPHDAAVLIDRLRQSDFSRVGVFIGPRTAIAPHFAASFLPDGHSAMLTEFIDHLNEKNMKGNIKGIDALIGAFADKLFDEYPQITSLRVDLPLPRNHLEKRFAVTALASGVQIERKVSETRGASPRG